MASRSQTPYVFSEDATVIIPDPKKQQITLQAGNLAETGVGQMARWNMEFVELQHAKNGKDFRIKEDGDAMDVEGGGGKFTKVHQQDDGKWTTSSLYPRGAVAEKRARSLHFAMQGVNEDEMADFLKDKFIPEPDPPRAKPMNVDEYVQKYAKTGDVLLFSGNDTFSKMLRLFTDGGYHHVAVVIKDKLKNETEEMAGKVRILQSLFLPVDVDYTPKDPKKTKPTQGAGVVITDFAPYFKYEMESMNGGTAYVRRLEGSDEKLREISQNIMGWLWENDIVGNHPYTFVEDPFKTPCLSDVLAIIQTKLPKSQWTKRSAYKTYVCSTLIAHTLIAAGVFNDKKHPLGNDIHWFPKDFSATNLPTGDEPNKDYNAGVSLGKEIQLNTQATLMAKL